MQARILQGWLSLRPSKSFDRELLQIPQGRKTKGAQVDAAQQVQVKKPAHLYGCRGTDPQLVYLLRMSLSAGGIL